MTSAEHNDTEYERIARQLSGEAGDAERADFRRLLEDPAYRALFEASRRDWEATGMVGGVDVEAGWSRLRSRLVAVESGDGQPRVLHQAIIKPPVRPWWRSSGGLLRAATVGFALIGAGLVWSRLRGSEPSRSPAAFAESAAVTTKVAERKEVNLPDGTVVQLGATSLLRTLEGYGGTAREVELTGEASFRVTHDAARPFRVRAAGALIEDLGTVFVVRAVTGAPLRVAVSEGSVAVRRTGAGTERQVVLQPRDVALLADTGEVLVSRGVDVEPFTAWTSGRLVFRNTTLREAIVDLERWYDVRFEVSDAALLSKHLDVVFTGQGVDEVLQVIGTALSVRFERDGRSVRVAAPARTGLVPVPAMQVGGGA